MNLIWPTSTEKKFVTYGITNMSRDEMDMHGAQEIYEIANSN